MKFALVTLAIAAIVAAEVYFKETFDDASWEDRWIQSKHKDDYGEFKLSVGKFFGDEKRDQGIKISQDAKFYSCAAKFDKYFSKAGKSVVIQYTVKHEQGIDCGGGYVKVMAADANLEDFHGETPHNLMFGSDICGPSKKVHVIFSYKGKNNLFKKDRCKVKAGTIFNNVLVTDSIEDAKEHAAERFEPPREAEKEKKEASKLEAEEKKRKEEEDKKKSEENEDDDDEEGKEKHDDL